MATQAEKLISAQTLMRQILVQLKVLYAHAKCSLDFENPFQLLTATILSAQCTDERVNKVTPNLWKHFPTPDAMAKAKIADVEKIIQSTGFYKNKAKSLVECSKQLVELHGGSVPKDLAALTALRGVGRKTGNVVLGNAFGIPGLVVDTHVGRLCRRFGFTKETNAVKVEQAMMQIVPKEDWTIFSHLLIYHGRSRCMARNPNRGACEFKDVCPKIGVAKKGARR